ncbi:MAG: ParM/StbA family protein [Thermoflexales bacterium]|nr:ParM/StbA family protein [Thermoflexales bacterium]
MNNSISLGFDFGMGALKLQGPLGGLEMETQVSVNGGQRLARMMGLRSQKLPMQVVTSAGSFHVGPGAHNCGRAVENLDYDRLFSSAPEMRALLYGCLTRFSQQYGPLDAPLSITVGLPLEPMAGEQATVTANIEAVRRWMKGTHTWLSDGQEYQVDVAEVKVTSQAVGALFDHVLDDDGRLIPARKGDFKKELGIASVGFNTVELMVVKDRSPVQKFTAGSTCGVRRLLELVNLQQFYSLGELDAQLRAGQLDVNGHIPVWAEEVRGFIEKKWGRAWRRFASIVLVGGGAILLRSPLTTYFEGRAVMPDDPVLATARGLYKLALSQKKE